MAGPYFTLDIVGDFKDMKSQTPLISVYTTVYNSKRTVEESLNSIAKALEGFDYEIVIVDNFSNDGTYEVLIKLSKRYPIRIYRYRCSRGLGRCIASRLSRGKYLVYVDLDCIYSGQLPKIISGYLQSGFRNSKCLEVLVCPKHILESYQYKDLNRAEDVDLMARLFKNKMAIGLPSLKKYIKIEVRSAQGNAMRFLDIFPFLTTYLSEIRYVRNTLSYIKRELRNKLDFITGGAITFSKFVREEVYVYRMWRRTRLLVILIRILAIIPFLILHRLLKRQVFEGDPKLSNHFYVIYGGSESTVNPTELGFQINELTISTLSDPAIRYIARYHPDITRRKKYTSDNIAL